MDLTRIAKRVGDKTKKPKKPSKTSLRKKPELTIPEIGQNVLSPGVEYSFKVDLSFTVDFEGSGDVSEIRVRNKLKSEIAAAIKGAVLMAANDFQLQASNISVQPARIESALNDQMHAVEPDDR